MVWWRWEVKSASGSGNMAVEEGWAGAENARMMSGALLRVLYVWVVSRGVKCPYLGDAVSSESARGLKYGPAVSKGWARNSELGVSCDKDEGLLTGIIICGMVVLGEVIVSLTI